MLLPICQRCYDLAADLKARTRNPLPALVERVSIHDAKVVIDVSAAGLTSALQLPLAGSALPITLSAAVRLTRTGRAMRLIQGDGGLAAGPQQDNSLIKLIAKARVWWQALAEGKIDIKRYAEAEGVSASYMTRVVRLAFLAPDIVEHALNGTLKAGIDGAALLETGAVPARWAEQRARYAVH